MISNHTIQLSWVDQPYKALAIEIQTGVQRDRPQVRFLPIYTVLVVSTNQWRRIRVEDVIGTSM